MRQRRLVVHYLHEKVPACGHARRYPNAKRQTTTHGTTDWAMVTCVSCKKLRMQLGGEQRR